MVKNITPYAKSGESKKKQVTRMFDNISNEYDRLNRIFTFGIDIKWRKRVIKLIADTHPEKILDIATGTGDLAIMAAERTKATEIIGADISDGMLAIGQKKVIEKKLSERIQLVNADSENLPYQDNYFDAVSVAFGVRNFENLNQGIQEIHRVLKPGGLLVVLETSVPSTPVIKQLYLFHSNYLLPFFGRIFSRDAKAYKYLSKSAKNFPYGKEFNNILIQNGFNSVKDKPQFFGASSIYVAKK